MSSINQTHHEPNQLKIALCKEISQRNGIDILKECGQRILGNAHRENNDLCKLPQFSVANELPIAQFLVDICMASKLSPDEFMERSEFCSSLRSGSDLFQYYLIKSHLYRYYHHCYAPIPTKLIVEDVSDTDTDDDDEEYEDDEDSDYPDIDVPCAPAAPIPKHNMYRILYYLPSLHRGCSYLANNICPMCDN